MPLVSTKFAGSDLVTKGIKKSQGESSCLQPQWASMCWGPPCNGHWRALGPPAVSHGRAPMQQPRWGCNRTDKASKIGLQLKSNKIWFAHTIHFNGILKYYAEYCSITIMLCTQFQKHSSTIKKKLWKYKLCYTYLGQIHLKFLCRAWQYHCLAQHNISKGFVINKRNYWQTIF